MRPAYTEPKKSQTNVLFYQKDDYFSKQKPRYIAYVEFGSKQHSIGKNRNRCIQIYFNLNVLSLSLRLGS